MSQWGKISYLVSALSLLVLLVTRFILGGWIDVLFVPLGLFLAGIVVALVVDYRFYFEFLTMRTTKHGMNMGALILMALVLLVAVNFLSVRYNKTVDLTEERLHSLAPQTMDVLSELESEAQFYVFYRGADDRKRRQELRLRLQPYQDRSSQVRVQFVNAYVDVQRSAEFLKDQRRFAVFLKMGGRQVEVAEPYQEEQITSALIRVTRDSERMVYFLTGHGEKSIDDHSGEGLAILREGLEANSFQVANLNLLIDEVSPSPGQILAIIGPQTAFIEQELDKIEEFAKSGGKLFIAGEPGARSSIPDLTRRFGVEFKNNFVLQEQLVGFGMAGVIGSQYDSESEITKPFSGRNMMTLFMGVSEVLPAANAPLGLNFTELVRTDRTAFAVNDLNVRPLRGEKRVYTVAVLVEGSLTEEEDFGSEEPQFSAVIFGDSEFVSDNVIIQGENRNLALNAFAHLAEDPGLISIRPPQPKGTTLTLTQNQWYGIVTAGVSIPLVLLVGSGFIWYRRRGL